MPVLGEWSTIRKLFYPETGLAELSDRGSGQFVGYSERILVLRFVRSRLETLPVEP
jgi:hypothetical protein